MPDSTGLSVMWQTIPFVRERKMQDSSMVMHDGSLLTKGGSYRKDYVRFNRGIKTSKQFTQTVRLGKILDGGYELFFICDDGAAICQPCAREEARQIIYSIRNKINDGWRVIGAGSTSEGDEPLQCAHCNNAIGA